MNLEKNEHSSYPAGASSFNQPAPPPPPRRRNNTAIYLIIIALLLGTNAYLFFSRRSTQQQQAAVTEQRDSIIITKNNLQEEYDAALSRLDALTTSNVALQKEITDKDGELQKLRNQLDGIMRKENKTEADYKKAQDLIAKLNSRVRSFEERIAALETENKALQSSNETLTAAVDSTAAEAENLRKVGSVLHASNIRMVPINLRRGGTKESETSKAKRTDLIRIYFDIDENRIATSGSKELFLRITGPDGNLLSNAAYGSGVTTDADGENINYTLSKQVTLQQNSPVKDVTIDWNQDSGYKKGNYSIQIYHDGYQIGTGTVALK